MLLNLPEDCLHEIYNHLELQDCLVMADVCQNLREFTIHRLSCRTEAAYWLQHKALRPLPKRLKQLIARSTSAIKCRGDFLYSIKSSLCRLEFPGITSLTIAANNFKNLVADDLEQLLTDVFPQLEKLRISGEFQGHFLWNLKNLAELDIDSAAFNENNFINLKMMELRKLCLKQPLKEWSLIKELTNFQKLQELQICANDYTQFALNSGFKMLNHLSKLVLTITSTEYYVFFKDSNYYRKIDSICFNMRLNSKHSFNQHFFGHMTKLRKLYFVNDDGSTLNAFYKHVNGGTEWPTLEEIYYINAENTTKTQEEQLENLLSLVKNAKNLKLLDVTGSPFGDDFLKRISVLYYAQSRRTRLLVRCRNSKIMENEERVFLPKTVKLCFHNSNHMHKLPPLNSVEIYFNERHSLEETITYLAELLEILSRVCDIQYLSDVLNEKRQKLQTIRNEEFILDSVQNVSEDRLRIWRGLLNDVRENMYAQIGVITEMVLSYLYLN